VEEGGRAHDALIICSFGVNPGYVLVDNPDYPDIADDYVATFAKARAMEVDVFLAPHGSQYGLAAKHAALLARGPGDPNPFIDRPGYLAHIDAQEANFRRMLEAQQ
jgi:metallo-beta-lactamase class B